MTTSDLGRKKKKRVCFFDRSILIVSDLGAVSLSIEKKKKRKKDNSIMESYNTENVGETPEYEWSSFL